MKRCFTLIIACLLLNSFLYGSEDLFRYKVALRIASMPIVKNLSGALTDIETGQVTFHTFNKIDSYLNEVKEDLALFTCAKEPKNTFQWVMKYKETGKVIGLVGLYSIDEKHASATLALYLEPEYRSKEILAEAMKGIIDFGFTRIGLNRIDFYLYPDKIGFTKTSLVCDSLGFSKVGELPEFIYHSGCYHSFIYYCLLSEKFKKF